MQTGTESVKHTVSNWWTGEEWQVCGELQRKAEYAETEQLDVNREGRTDKFIAKKKVEVFR